MKPILAMVCCILVLAIVAVGIAIAAMTDVLELPIATHTDSLRDGMWNTIHATPTNTSWVVRMETKDIRAGSTNKDYQIAFGIQIYSEVKSQDWYATQPPSGKPIATTIFSNVIARIVWKGQTNECVLERNP